MASPVLPDLTALSPVEIDTVLSKLWSKAQTLREHIASYRKLLASPHAYERQVADFRANIAAYEARLVVIRAEAAPYEAEFSRRGGWNRYFLVTNSNGHVHRGTSCGTCFPTTQYSWLIELADCDEDAMVEEWGEKACTVCFKDAPSNPNFYRPSRLDREARAARDADKAAKAADKAAKAITAPNGRPLRVGSDVLRTKVAAQRKLSDVVQSFGWYGPSHPSDFAGQARTLIEALTAAGIDPQPIIERAAKKVAKEGGPHDIRNSL